MAEIDFIIINIIIITSYFFYQRQRTQYRALQSCIVMKDFVLFCFPDDNSRIVLKEGCDLTGSDYINASKIVRGNSSALQYYMPYLDCGMNVL